MRRYLPALLAACFAVAGAASARAWLEPEAARIGRIRDPSWLPRGDRVRQASFGQRLTLADLYWLRTVQYVGESVLAPDRGWAALYPLADIVTDLDPRFGYAYQVAGSNLSGLAHRLEESDRLLEKGMRNVPDRWTLPFVRAVNKFLFEGDFAAAARYARRAAEVGHRPQLALLAANLSLAAERSDEYATAEAFLGESIRQADNQQLADQLRARLVKVRTYAALARVEAAVRAFRERNVRAPLVLEELVRAGLLPVMPRDPSGGAITYDPLAGTVRSTVLGERRPLRVTE